MADPDTNSPADLVRLLINDPTSADNFFTNAEIAAFLALEDDSVKRAAAVALETIASNEALVSKVIRTQDLATDGPAVAAELRARAQMLREQDEESEDGFFVDVLDFNPYPTGDVHHWGP